MAKTTSQVNLELTVANGLRPGLEDARRDLERFASQQRKSLSFDQQVQQVDRFRQRAELLMGGGAVVGFDMIGRGLANTTERLSELDAAIAEGKMTRGEAFGELMKSLPVAGGFVSAGENLTKFLSGEAKHVREAEALAAENAKAGERQAELAQRRAADLAANEKMRDELRLSQLQGFEAERLKLQIQHQRDAAEAQRQHDQAVLDKDKELARERLNLLHDLYDQRISVIDRREREEQQRRAMLSREAHQKDVDAIMQGIRGEQDLQRTLLQQVQDLRAEGEEKRLRLSGDIRGADMLRVNRSYGNTITDLERRAADPDVPEPQRQAAQAAADQLRLNREFDRQAVDQRHQTRDEMRAREYEAAASRLPRLEASRFLTGVGDRDRGIIRGSSGDHNSPANKQVELTRETNKLLGELLRKLTLQKITSFKIVGPH